VAKEKKHQIAVLFTTPIVEMIAQRIVADGSMRAGKLMHRVVRALQQRQEKA